MRRSIRLHPFLGFLCALLLTARFEFFLNAHAADQPLRPAPIAYPISYPIEGSVRVPLRDPAPSGGKDDATITLSHRLFDADQVHKPWLFVINGGPGMASTSYADYGQFELKRLAGYRPYFRIALFDQRGTGRSSPLDREGDDLDPEQLMRHYTASSSARDLDHLIRQVVQPGERYWVFAHSYGGTIALHYFDRPREAPRPDGVILASIATPFVDPMGFISGRSDSQFRLNQEVMGQRPDLQAKVLSVRDRIRSANYVHPDGTPLVAEDLDAAWRKVDPKAPQALEDWLDHLLSSETPIAQVASELRQMADGMEDRITYAISAIDVTPGLSDAAAVERLKALAASQAPEWMILEWRVLMSKERQRKFRGGAWAGYYDTVDRLAPRIATLPELARIRENLKGIPVIYLAGDQDPYIGIDSSREQFAAIASGPEHHFETIEGGNHSSAQGTQAAEFVAKRAGLSRCGIPFWKAVK